jgi:hypothetical protein
VARVRLKRLTGFRQAARQRSRRSDAGPHTIAVPGVVTPLPAAGAQNAPGWTTRGESAGAGGAVVGGWGAGGPASLPFRKLACAMVEGTLCLCDCSADITGQITISLENLERFAVAVHNLDGTPQ